MLKIYNNEKALKAIDAIAKSNLPCLLLGETGTGKTTIVRAVAEKQGAKLTRINLNGQTSREELLGKFILHEGATKRQDGPLLTALKEGHWILLDEINAALPEVLFTIQALTETIDGKLGQLLLAENEGEVVVPHDACRIFATANPADKYVGTKSFNPATLSRFVVVNVEALSPIDERQLLIDRFPRVKKSDITKLIKIAGELRVKSANDDIEFFCSTRELVNTCVLINEGLSIQEAVAVGILNKVQNKFELVEVGKIVQATVGASDESIEQTWDKMVSSVDGLIKLQQESLTYQTQIKERDDMIKTLRDQADQNAKMIEEAKKIKQVLDSAASAFTSQNNSNDGTKNTEQVTS